MLNYLPLKKEHFKFIFFSILVILLLDIVGFIFFNNPICIKMVRLVSEKNIPSLFSTLQLMLSGTLLYLIYDQSKKENIDRSICGFWKFLSVLFYILAFDEWFTIHDTLGKLFSDGMGGLGDLFGWTLLYMILIPLFLLASIRFLLALPKPTALGFIVSGMIFVIGAIGLELLNKSAFQLALNFQLSPLMSYVVVFLEESFEILGIFLFNFFVFTYGQNYLNLSVWPLPKRWYFGAFLFGFLDTVVTVFVQFSV